MAVLHTKEFTPQNMSHSLPVFIVRILKKAGRVTKALHCWVNNKTKPEASIQTSHLLIEVTKWFGPLYWLHSVYRFTFGWFTGHFGWGRWYIYSLAVDFIMLEIILSDAGSSSIIMKVLCVCLYGLRISRSSGSRHGGEIRPRVLNIRGRRSCPVTRDI